MTTTQAIDPYLQVVVNGDLSSSYEPFQEKAFRDALGTWQLRYQPSFTAFVREYWPALGIVQCMLAAKRAACFSFRDIRFLSHDASLVVMADIDGPALAVLPPDVRAAQVFRIAMTLTARALEKRKIDAAPLLVWRDAQVPAAGDVSMPVEIRPPKRERAPKALTESLVATLLPVAWLHGTRDGRRVFHTAWVGDDDERPGLEFVVDVAGTIGEYSETRDRALADGETWERAILERLAPSWDAGLRPVKDDDCVDLQIDYPIDGMGTEDDLARRHAIEDSLGEQLFLRGVGNVDGGESGSGEMSVFATVLDGAVAPEDVLRWLQEAGHPAPSRITLDE